MSRSEAVSILVDRDALRRTRSGKPIALLMRNMWLGNHALSFSSLQFTRIV
ncbi:hypothetical protein [Leptolyngbya ohadii]|uniref:hypothetical protein n=1 Tax=Leptolyngbya ohadii TaxID=1962290 RepID=UPI0019D4D89F|nr:hypothetical protein [Leptolyngbya ohadii]